jgi:hypothetical protein
MNRDMTDGQKGAANFPERIRAVFAALRLVAGALWGGVGGGKKRAGISNYDPNQTFADGDILYRHCLLLTISLERFWFSRTHLRATLPSSLSRLRERVGERGLKTHPHPNPPLEGEGFHFLPLPPLRGTLPRQGGGKKVCALEPKPL